MRAVWLQGALFFSTLSLLASERSILRAKRRLQQQRLTNVDLDDAPNFGLKLPWGMFKKKEADGGGGGERRLQSVRKKASEEEGGATEFHFDDAPASSKKWLVDIVKRTNPLNKESEKEMDRRKADKQFRLSGPRTFLLTVGGMGVGKGYAMSRLFNEVAKVTVGEKDDFVSVDPDDVRQGSQTFKEILAVGKRQNKSMPKNLIADDKLFQCRGGLWDKKNCTWIKITHTYNYGTLKAKYLDPAGKTSIIYDSACTDLKYCEGLLEKASNAGFERLIVLWVHVDVKCSHHRAAIVRPAQQGRYTTKDNVYSSWTKATENAPKLMQAAQKLVATKPGKVKSWVTIKSSGIGEQDAHSCPKETRLSVRSGGEREAKQSLRKTFAKSSAPTEPQSGKPPKQSGKNGKRASEVRGSENKGQRPSQQRPSQARGSGARGQPPSQGGRGRARGGKPRMKEEAERGQ